MGSPHPAKKLAATVLLWLIVASLIFWAVGRVFSDRTLPTQFVSWVPAFAVLSFAGSLVLARWLLLRGWAHDRDRRIQRVVGALVGLACCAWLWNDWNAPGILRREHPAQLRLFAWNATTVKMPTIAEVAARERPALALLANTQFQSSLVPVRDVLSAAAADFGQPPRTYASSSIRLHIVSIFPILHTAWMPLGITGAKERTFTWDGGGMKHVDVGEALLVELDTRSIWNRTTVVWLVDLPSDPDIPRARMMREARATIDSFAVAVMLRTEEGLDRTLAGADRDAAIARLRAPDIVAGDFNTPRGAESLATLLAPLSHARDAGAGPGVIVTYPRAAPLLHIDHVFTAQHLRASTYRVFDPGAGRHKAQVADLRAAP
jgi:hypothetical protein